MSTTTIERPSTDIEVRPEDVAGLIPDHAPLYAVILHNDPVNTFEFVIEVLQKVFGYALEKAFVLTLEAHELGRSIVWSGELELAELYADRIRSCGPDPNQKKKKARPLSVSIEPLPR